MLKQTIDFGRPLACLKYGRMSNETQNPRSPDQQFGEIDREITRGGYTWRIVREFRDDAVKGAYIRRRPEFFKMLTLIRTGQLKVDAILVDTAERFGRADEIPGIRQELWNQYGVLVLTADSHFADPTTTAGKALTFVEQIRSTGGNEVKAHEVRRGKLDKAKAKKWPGGPVPFGKRLLRKVVTDHRGREAVETDLVGDPETEWIVRRLFHLALETKEGACNLARVLNDDPKIPDKCKPFRADTVGYWLDNPIYAGVYRWAQKCTGIRNDTRVQQRNPDGPELVHGFCEPLITFEQWQEIQAVRRRRGEQIRRRRDGADVGDAKQIVALGGGLTLNYLLSGLVFCGDCNARMVACSSRGHGRNGTRYAYYRCPLYTHSGGHGCTNGRYVREGRLRAAVIARLRERLLPPPACNDDGIVEAPAWLVELDTGVRREVERLGAAAPDHRSALRHDAADLDSQVRGLDESLRKRDLPPLVRQRYESQVDDALRRVEQIRFELAELDARHARVDRVLDVRAVLDRLRRLDAVLADGSVTDGNAELSLHVQGIYCSADGRVEMRTCKLGCFDGAAELLARPASGGPRSIAVATGATPRGGDAPGVGAAERAGAAAPAGPSPRYQVRSRRRSRLRTTGTPSEQDGAVRALCPDRFAGLEAHWFWIEPVDVGRAPAVDRTQRPARVDDLSRSPRLVAKPLGQGVPEHQPADRDARPEGRLRQVGQPLGA